MAQDNRKRHIISYENLSAEVAAAFSQKYPKGYNDYLPDLNKYTKPDGTVFYAVLLELPEDIYLVKIKIKTDDLDDIEKWLEGEEDAGTESVTGAHAGSSDSADTLPDDNISQYGGDENSDGAE